ncbi:MAG: glycoside hydrolase family 2 protein, partial [Candidatus Heimdallarchaeota archaeon]
YTVTSAKADFPNEFEGKILVPFAIESPLSGVKRQLYPKDRLWYQRSFTIPKDWKNKRILLHFGAVDWECKIWVNKKEVGSHRGGYSPFSFDITEYVEFEKENQIQIRVYDPSEKGKQPSGKQWLKPAIVFYTTVSGIWQTVWLESVPKIYITDIKLTPDIDEKVIKIKTNIVSSENHNIKIEGIINDNGNIIAEFTGDPNSEINVLLQQFNLWSPETPFLYDLEINLVEEGIVIDTIESYFAMRKFSLEKDKEGIPRFNLNNEPYFMVGLLDQGYWPDGLYTAPTDEALKWDIELTKEFGFNTIRKHIKTEPARWYYFCDKLGVLVWQDMINGGGKYGIIPNTLIFAFGLTLNDSRCYWKTGQRKQWLRDNFELELKEMIDSLYNVPSICMWVPFNESWGQFDAKRIGKWVMNYDPSRLVDHASGWYDQKSGHFISIHDYRDKFKMPKEITDRGVVLSETGGYTLPIPECLWDPKKKFGYKKITSQEELEKSYQNLVKKILKPSIKQGLSGVIYTQTTDVEIEYNGIVTYDRKIKKMDAEKIAKLNKSLN